MIIRDAEIVPYAIPLRTPFEAAHGRVTSRHGFLLLLRSEGGVLGVGDGAPHPADGAATFARVRTALDEAAGWLVGADGSRLDEILGRAGRLPPAAAMAVDMALHDLVARAAGRPLAELLGGRVRDRVPVSALLVGDGEPASDVAGREPDAAGRQCRRGYVSASARRAVAEGFTHAKLKASADVAETLASVAAVRRAAPGLSLRVDANGRWSRETAAEAAARLRPFDLEWLEQPVRPGDTAALAHVRRSARIPIAADEAVTGPEAVERLAAAEAADVIVVKLAQVGGLERARRTAAAAVAAGMSVVLTTGIDTAVATAAVLHLAAALPGPLQPCGFATGHLLGGDLVGDPIREAPLMMPPPGPGLGVTLDPAALARWRVEAPG